jgi:hypothetical protein
MLSISLYKMFKQDADAANVLFNKCYGWLKEKAVHG